MSAKWLDSTIRLDDNLIKIPQTYKPGMRVPGLVFASKAMEESLFSDNALEQVANVATLPGIVNVSIAMPDIHWGYGFPIGGVAAFE
ncbi:MAG: RNA-splicing ligase RtcB, partial [Caldiserica bacterium]|nr:RNA-splicing ligase RtcB [Caldisericota bacterium]